MFFQLHDQEAYDLIHSVLPSFEEREIVRVSPQFKGFLNFWCEGHYNAANKVGYVMAAAGKLPKNGTHDDWEMLYYKECKTPSQVLIQIEVLMADADIDFKTAVTYWWIHIQDGFYKGSGSEKKVIAIAEKQAALKGWKIRPATDHEDRRLGVDAVVYDPNNNNKPVLGMQIKPQSNFIDHPAVNKNREYDQNKFKLFTQEYGCPVWYVVVEPTLKSGEIFWKKV